MVRFDPWTKLLRMPNITKTPPMIAQRLIRNLLSGLFDFVITMVTGLKSIDVYVCSRY